MRGGRVTRTIMPLVAFLLFAREALAQGYKPGEAAARMTVAEGLEARLFASEPLVLQPVAMTFDERGRLWVIQYLQYPNPAGLKRVKVDRYSRTVYDRVPEPPPHGPQGADRITILEDTDGDGVADRAKDFVGGLNLATGLLPGHGGVFVVQAPYLLFYADRDRNDVPDGEPEVLLSGFGMEDAHALANSLAWGPDGWLYGAQGSTVTAKIDGVEFQQGIWRYHPRTKKFELFAEGGGNTWGLDFDRHGNLLAGTNVGGYALLHQVQGGYYWKSFGKHGALHNPYAFGYLEHVAYADFRGGHVTCGGIVYDDDGLPDRFRGRYIAANLLSHAVHWHELAPAGSTFRARFGGELLTANDAWFAPVDLCVGPDGAVYVADWHDERTAHPDPDAEWDRSNGRIYRVQAKGHSPRPNEDFAKKSNGELITLLSSTSGWRRATARRLLIERGETTHGGEVIERAIAEPGDGALDYLWAGYCLGGLDEQAAARLLRHPHEYARTWTVRLLGDEGNLPDALAPTVVELAQRDASSVVRSQLACTARRLPARQALPIIEKLLRRDEDAGDAQIPLLAWWAVEQHADEHGALLDLFRSGELWQARLAREAIVERLARRWATTGSANELEACAKLYELAPDGDARRLVLRGLVLGAPRQAVAELPKQFRQLVERLWQDRRGNLDVLELGSRFGLPGGQAELVGLALDDTQSEERRVRAASLSAEYVDGDQTLRFFSRLADHNAPQAVRLAMIDALSRRRDRDVAGALVALRSSLEPALAARAIEAVASRADGAMLVVDEVASGRLKASDVPTEALRTMAAHGSAELDAKITKIWGAVRESTPEEKLAVVRRLNNDLRATSGDATAGRKLFGEHCGKCHRLFGEGNNVGPDLTSANRGDRDFLLVSLVDPSAQVRKEYLSHVVQTTDGRVATGIVVEETPRSVTLVDANNARAVVNKASIETIEPAEQSLMPEGLIEKLTPAQLRDLFAYLQGK